jgi:hypothetical protein
MPSVDHVDQFIAAMRTDPIFAPLADDMAFGLAELDELSETNRDVAEIHKAVSWILRQPRTVDEKFKAMERLRTAGKVENMSVRQLTGLYPD